MFGTHRDRAGDIEADDFGPRDRKSTRLNSSHLGISYAGFCWKKKSLNSRFKSLDTLKVKIISVTFRRVIRTKHKKASKMWRPDNIQLVGCQYCRLFPTQIRAN